MDDIVPLVTYQNGVYEVCVETLDWLKSLKTNIAVLVCCGKFRTGKSFLMNRMLQMGPNRGFGVGDTVNSCTKGLWLSKKTIPINDKLHMIVVDAEGIDSLDASATHDSRIFTLGILLSSVFVYNSMGVLDEAAVKVLSFMTQVADSIKDHSNSPQFYWVLRDFSLELVSRDGVPMEPDEYLEDCLAPDETTRNSIKALFKERHLFTLPRPSKNDITQKLDQKHSNISPKFTQNMARMRDTILENAKPIEMNGIPMSGEVFGNLVEQLVSVVQTSAVPEFCDMWTMMARVQQRDLIQQYVVRSFETIHTWESGTESVMQSKTASMISSYVNEYYDICMSPKPSKESIETEITSVVLTAIQPVLNSKTIDANQLANDCLNQMETEIASSFDVNTIVKICDDFKQNHGLDIYNTYLAPLVLKTILIKWFPEQMEVAKQQGNDCRIVDLTMQLHSIQTELESEREMYAQAKKDMMSTMDKVAVCIDSACQTEEEEDEPVISPLPLDDTDSILSMRQELEDANTERDQLKQELVMHQDELKKLSSSVKGELQEVRKRFDEEKRRLVAELEQERQSLKDAQIEGKAWKDRNEWLVNELKQANDRVVQVQTNLLNDFKSKEAHFREKNSEWVREQLDWYSQMTEQKRISACATTEVVYLKRKLDDYDETQDECKRMRRESQSLNVQKARSDVEIDHLKTSVKAVTMERNSLQKHNMMLENKLAVLQTTVELQACRNSCEER